MNRDPKGFQMTLPARAENVAIVRHALAGLAEEIGMEEPCLADLKTVVTEACMNVVVHAYSGEPGPLSVEAEPETEGLTVVVRDAGVGIKPQADVERPSLRLGLSLIAALSSSFAISGGLGQGTEITMRLPLQPLPSNGSGDSVALEPASPVGTKIAVGRAELLAPILGRVVGVLAAQQDLSVDRLSDAVLITDAIAAAAPSRFADGHVRLGLDGQGAEGLELRLGPMEDGGAEQILKELEVPELGGSLRTLADELSAEGSTDGDYLVIRFAGA